ncbi:MAG TPA: M43 family zinc metalloprotease [Puia sp.]|nr:M43 family zinc metalloprotease [Puia sp.]
MRIFLPLLLLLSLRLSVVAQQRDCGSTAYMQAMIRNNPDMEARIQQIAAFTRQQLQSPTVVVTGTEPAGKGTSVVRIPVIVHIVYNSSSQNISDAQVQSQLDVLNRDYRKLNADTAKIPGYYSPLAADCGFQFVLANLDTNGNATTGIIHRHTNVQAFQIDDAIKFTARGGDDAWDRDRYLNLWVGNLTPGILGYSSIPGCSRMTDGVSISYKAFGTTGTAAAPFNLGRTATHEIGHWLNLIHIWGDADCGDDGVDDTPQQQAATRGNPSGMIFSCGNTPYGNLYMDYMDFTDDAGMHLFTYGQRNRMRTLFAEGGFRVPLLTSNALSGAPVSGGTTTTGPVSPVDEKPVLRFYPNPAINTVSVNVSEGSCVGSLLEVYDQVGQRLMTTRITGTSFLLNVSSLPRGLYFIRVNGSGINNSFRLMKM